MARACFAAVTLVMALAGPLGAAPYSLDGSWSAGLVVNGVQCVLALVMSAQQHYDETAQCGPYKTWQRGTYVFANGPRAHRPGLRAEEAMDPGHRL